MNKFLATLGTAVCALALSATASFAGYFEPGETMGSSLASPLPEGIFFVDTASYGQSDKQPDLNIGVNIPVVIWSTPFSFYNTRIEAIVAIPEATFTGARSFGVNDRFSAATQAYGIILAHDFGGGLTGGVVGAFRTADPSARTTIITGRTDSEADFRESLQYTFSSGVFSGITLIENAGFTTAFKSNYPINDMFAGDFAIEKTIGKLSFGVVGFGNVDTNNVTPPHITSIGLLPSQQASMELGGLIAYDFGRFSLTAIVTRTVYVNSAQVSGEQAGGLSGNGHETRGWLRAVVPLYVAPAPAAPVVARY